MQMIKGEPRKHVCKLLIFVRFLFPSLGMPETAEFKEIIVEGAL